MSVYGVGDFSETISGGRVTLESPPVRVVAAWGEASGMGQWSPGEEDPLGYARTEWSGGFLCTLANGRFAYITGWNDYTGWGCQDGAEVAYFDALPKRSTLKTPYGDAVDQALWDEDPADLNRWIAAGMPDLYSAGFATAMKAAPTLPTP